MSYPVANNVQYRLSEEEGGTLIKFRHSGFGAIQEDHKKGVVTAGDTFTKRFAAAQKDRDSNSHFHPIKTKFPKEDHRVDCTVITRRI